MMAAFASSSFFSMSARDELAVVLVQRVADAVLLQAQALRTGLPGAVLGTLEGLVDGDVDALEHRGQHAAGVEVVLVAVHADRQLALVGRRLQHAQAGGTGGGVDHVRTLVELADRELAAARRVVPGCRRGAGIVGEDGGTAAGVLHALLVAELEVADQRDVHAADEADLAGLARHDRGHADEEAALMLLEGHRLHVGQVDHAVDDRELGVGIVLGDLLERRRILEAHHDHDVRTAPGHALHGLLALRLLGHLELEIGDAGLALELLGPVIGRLVERLVELAAHVEDDGRLEVLSRGAADAGQKCQRCRSELDPHACPPEALASR